MTIVWGPILSDVWGQSCDVLTAGRIHPSLSVIKHRFITAALILASHKPITLNDVVNSQPSCLKKDQNILKLYPQPPPPPAGGVKERCTDRDGPQDAIGGSGATRTKRFNFYCNHLAFHGLDSNYSN